MDRLSLTSKKCGTCEYCACLRKIKRGFLSTEPHVEFESTAGTCEKKGKSDDRIVKSRVCSKYKVWKSVELEIIKIEKVKQVKREELETKNIERENARIQNEILRTQQREIQRAEEERRIKELEEEKRKYEQWYLNLNDEEKREEDLRVKQEEETNKRNKEIAKKKYDEQSILQTKVNNKNKKIDRFKKLYFISFILFLPSILVNVIAYFIASASRYEAQHWLNLYEIRPDQGFMDNYLYYKELIPLHTTIYIVLTIFQLLIIGLPSVVAVVNIKKNNEEKSQLYSEMKSIDDKDYIY